MNEIKAEHKKLLSILIGVMTLTAIVICSAFYIYSYQKAAPLQIQTVTAQPEPTKTDFGTTISPEFPTTIPIEKGAKIEKSFSLDVAGQKQSFLVFLSTVTAADNYALYTAFFQKQGWVIVNKYESAIWFSLSATKSTDVINMTMRENLAATTKSEVSISASKI